MLIDSKVCTKCNQEKILTDFRKNPCTIDGRQTECKKCNSDRNIAIYNKDKKKKIDQVIDNRKRKRNLKNAIKELEKQINNGS